MHAQNEVAILIPKKVKPSFMSTVITDSNRANLADPTVPPIWGDSTHIQYSIMQILKSLITSAEKKINFE